MSQQIFIAVVFFGCIAGMAVITVICIPLFSLVLETLVELREFFVNRAKNKGFPASRGKR